MSYPAYYDIDFDMERMFKDPRLSPPIGGDWTPDDRTTVHWLLGPWFNGRKGVDLAHLFVVQTRTNADMERMENHPTLWPIAHRCRYLYRQFRHGYNGPKQCSFRRFREISVKYINTQRKASPISPDLVDAAVAALPIDPPSSIPACPIDLARVRDVLTDAHPLPSLGVGLQSGVSSDLTTEEQKVCLRLYVEADNWDHLTTIVGDRESHTRKKRACAAVLNKVGPRFNQVWMDGLVRFWLNLPEAIRARLIERVEVFVPPDDEERHMINVAEQERVTGVRPARITLQDAVAAPQLPPIEDLTNDHDEMDRDNTALEASLGVMKELARGQQRLENNVALLATMVSSSRVDINDYFQSIQDIERYFESALVKHKRDIEEVVEQALKRVRTV